MNAKAARKSTSKGVQKTATSGSAARLMTTSERIADMREFGRKQGQTKSTALSFLRAAGIITPTDKLAKPFRAD